jgi:hypothetical protein
MLTGMRPTASNMLQPLLLILWFEFEPGKFKDGNVSMAVWMEISTLSGGNQATFITWQQRVAVIKGSIWFFHNSFVNNEVILNVRIVLLNKCLDELLTWLPALASKKGSIVERSEEKYAWVMPVQKNIRHNRTFYLSMKNELDITCTSFHSSKMKGLNWIAVDTMSCFSLPGTWFPVRCSITSYSYAVVRRWTIEQ